MEQRILSILEELVAADTQNPPRNITGDHAVFQAIQQALPADCSSQLFDLGDGCVSMLVQRGHSPLLFNVHLDTVPCGDGWRAPPLELTVQEGRVYGRGACDIKGAAAALLVALQQCDVDFAVLFSTDEEGTGSRCVRAFCESAALQNFSLALVAEPTECQAVLEHRGYLSVRGEFSATAGHSSQFERLADSATHRAAQWVAQALQQVGLLETNELDGQATCFNVGRIDGGVKNNVIAEHCQVTWSMRLPPNDRAAEVEKQMLRDPESDVAWETTFRGPPLPRSRQQSAVAKAYCQSCGLPLADAVDFWTEASLFSEAGLPAFVMGPGNIAQAHTANEWVAVSQLVQAALLYEQCARHAMTWNP